MDRLAKSLVERQRVLRGPGGDGVKVMRDALVELEAASYLLRRKAGGGVAGHLRIEIFHSPAQAADAVPPVETDSDAVVYVIGQRGSGVVKIGTTANLKQRVASLQTGYPLALEVLGTHQGGWSLEQYLHERFAAKRMQGEWFDFGEMDPASAVDDAVFEKFPERYAYRS
ncbi:GIY-YIG nuclease family protein [Streptomyces krungchingensis]